MTKNDHLDIAMNDWEQILITRNNQDAKSHVTNNQESLGEMMWLGKLFEAECMWPQLFLTKILEQCR